MENMEANQEDNIVPFMVNDVEDSCLNCEFMQKDGLVCGILKNTKELYARVGKQLTSAEFGCKLHEDLESRESRDFAQQQ